MSTIERFAAKIALADSGCVEWLGARTGKGYGHLLGDASLVYAHRWSYEHHVGPIPDGLQIDHLCRNRGCVNPDHLEAVTARENLLRATGVAATNAAKTHCPAGHAYAGSNLYIQPNGGRSCRTCHRDRERASRQKRTVA